MKPEITIDERYVSSQKFRLFTVNFFGSAISVIVTASASVVKKWLKTTLYLVCRRYLFDRVVICVGVQWNPSNGNNSADTLQLCVSTRCLIFQLSQSDTVPLLLRRFLLEPNNTLVGLWNGADAKKLLMTEHELRVHKLLDLRRYVESKDGESLARASVERIVEECLGFEGVRLERDISMSDWDDEDLSDEQVLQAFVDAYVPFEIGRNLRAWSF